MSSYPTGGEDKLRAILVSHFVLLNQYFCFKITCKTLVTELIKSLSPKLIILFFLVEFFLTLSFVLVSVCSISL